MTLSILSMCMLYHLKNFNCIFWLVLTTIFEHFIVCLLFSILGKFYDGDLVDNELPVFPPPR